MTDQRMALLARLEQAARSTEPDVVREALRWAIEALMPYARAVSENLPWRLPTE